jgi:cyclomaltodextrinase / maltogenic alpha-amylase / neopullulanase
MEAPPLSEEATQLKLGVYEHYKGFRMELIGIARHSETLEELAVYRKLYGAHELWVRPLQMFLENVEIEGKIVPRFRFIS